MKVIEKCAACLWDKQENSMRNVEDEAKKTAYLNAVKVIIDDRAENDTAPFLVSLFKEKYVEIFGQTASSFTAEKRKYNDLVMDMLPELADKIYGADDPLKQALFQARIGNYIDFGAMNTVDEKEFLSLFDSMAVSEKDEKVYAQFLKECEEAKKFLFLADNCGEIVLDLLFLEQLHNRFPDMDITIMVRGAEVLNDVSIDDAYYVGLDKVGTLLENGNAVAGTEYELCSEEAKAAIDEADIIYAKGQGNYETLSGNGRHAYYSFLCKCDLFTERFKVPRLTGMLIVE